MENTIYKELREYVKVNHGFGEDLFNSDLHKRYLEAQESLRQFNNKKVKLSYSYTADLMGNSGIIFGKVVFFKKDNGNEEIRFYRGLNRTNYNYLDFGLYEGFFAVLIIHNIEEADLRTKPTAEEIINQIERGSKENENRN